MHAWLFFSLSISRSLLLFPLILLKRLFTYLVLPLSLPLLGSLSPFSHVSLFLSSLSPFFLFSFSSCPSLSVPFLFINLKHQPSPRRPPPLPFVTLSSPYLPLVLHFSLLFIPLIITDPSTLPPSTPVSPLPYHFTVSNPLHPLNFMAPFITPLIFVSPFRTESHGCQLT